MPHKFISGCILLFVLVAGTSSCSSAKKFTTKYYYQHQQALNKIEQSYKTMYAQKPFNLVFTDKEFTLLTLEIKTDTLTYIYQFDVDGARLTDTLTRYGLNAKGITQLISDMKSIQCIWINNLDYYVDDKKNSMIFMSVKPVVSNPPFGYKKYYILSYFKQPQYFDADGKLLVKRKLRKVHRINGDIFKRINDKICYTVSGRYR